MKHRVFGYKLGRNTPHRVSLFRNLAAGLFQHGQITTTLQKAKAVQPFVEKLISIARKGDLHSRRRVISKLGNRQLIKVIKGGQSEEVDDKTLIEKLFDDIAPRYADCAGGYTRIVRLPKHRVGDGSDLVILQLVNVDEDGGPDVKGRFSRRRQKQNNRMVYAAKLRKNTADATVAVDEDGSADKADAPVVEETAEEVAEETPEETTEGKFEETAEEDDDEQDK